MEVSQIHPKMVMEIYGACFESAVDLWKRLGCKEVPELLRRD